MQPARRWPRPSPRPSAAGTPRRWSGPSTSSTRTSSAKARTSNSTLNHLNRSQGSAGWPIEAKVRQAIEWSYENKAERENAIVHAYEQSKRNIARASSPGGQSFRDPTGADQGVGDSQEEANKKRFEVLQGKRRRSNGWWPLHEVTAPRGRRPENSNL